MAAYYFWPDDNRGDVSSTVSRISIKALVKNNDQDSILLKRRTRNQRPDLRFQPGIRCVKASIMRIVQQIRHYEGIVWQIVICEIARELAKGNNIIFFAAVRDIVEVCKW